MKYLKLFENFKVNDEIATLTEITNELKDDYFDVSVYDPNILAENPRNGGYFFKSLVDVITSWEKSYSFKNKYKSDQLEIINDIILIRIQLPDKEKFLWKDISGPITSSVNYMEFNGWRYILQPVWNDTSMNYRLDDMATFDIQNMQSYHIKFYR